MCGIVGWVDWKRDLTPYTHTLESMTDTLAHRGPDDRGFWAETHVMLGHRRLAVMDPEGGRQPMTRRKASKKCTVVYNGEIYNWKELRTELETRDYRFVTRNSDTEVLLTAYLEWGTEAIERLNGIFAFAVWDEYENSLLLVRDRVGVKPLFYYQYEGGLIFASELKALLAHPEISPRINAEGLAEVLVLGPARTPGHGVFKGIRELKPGHYVTFDRRGIHLTRYWHLESHPHEDDPATTAERVRYLLNDAVSRQLVADVPVCTLLSGGLDSTAVTVLASNALQEQGMPRISTFSVDYEEENIHFRPDPFLSEDDRVWAKRASDALGTDHNTVVIGVQELFEALKPAEWYNDLPGMADIDASLYLFCREVRRENVVALSGECADEIFGGYPWFYGKGVEDSRIFPWMRAFEKKMSLLSPEVRNHISPLEYVADRLSDALVEVPRLASDTPQEARIREIAYLSITRFMPVLLNRKDRMSMAWGLEIRVPFSDHRLIEYVWNIPWDIKNWDERPKGVLRQALQGVLPKEFLARRKNPYPKTHHPKYLDTVRKAFLEVVEEGNSPLVDLLNMDMLKKAAASKSPIFDLPWFGQLMGDAQYYGFLLQLHWWLANSKIQIV